MGDHFKSWGNYPYLEQSVTDLHWQDDAVNEISHCKSEVTQTLAVGLGRSYGDSCFTTGSKLLRTVGLDRIISLDTEKGIITAEAGISLDELLSIIVPKGWFLPVTPGTKYVTLGGAIANDVHGKNHHVSGTIGCFVESIGLYRSDLGLVDCSPDNNRQFYSATIGGLGLTGVILWVKLRLRKITSSYLDVTKIRFRNIQEYFEVASDLDSNHEFSVAWLDCTARGNRLGRGIYSAGKFSNIGALSLHKKSKISVPLTPSFSLVNKISVKLFNEMYYRVSRTRNHSRLHYDPFFYPLDGVQNWNRIYGSKGFQQYQCVIPAKFVPSAIPELLTTISKSGIGSFLVVLKRCGDITSPGLLSFPISGMTLAIDLPQSDTLKTKLLDKLNDIVMQSTGRLYPAKDAQMPADMFQSAYSNWKEFDNLRDPVLLSSFWERVAK